MGFKAKTKGGDGEAFPQAPEGNHRAVLVGLINLGHHFEEYKAQKPGEKDKSSWKEKVYLLFELLDEMNGETPWLVGKMYTLHLGERAALHDVYKAVVGPVPKEDEPEIIPMLGNACMVQISPSKNPKYTELANVSSAYGPDRKNPPRPQRTPFLCDIHEELIDNDLPYIYGQSISAVMAQSRERSGAKAPQGKAAQVNGGGKREDEQAA